MPRWAIALVLLLGSATVLAAETVDLVALQIQPAAKSSRFTIILTDKTKGHIQFYPHPDRVEVDFENTRKHFEMNHARLGGANVSMVNIEERPNQSTRLTLYVTGPVKWYVMVLPKDSDHAVRVLLDIISVPSAPPKQEKTDFSLKKRFQQSVLETFTTLSREIKERQQQGNDLLGQARMDTEYVITHTDKPEQFTVVIDAGHGGRDGGAKGPKGVQEKNIVLGIAKRLAEQINKQSGMRAILTRNSDVYVPLRQRLKLARKGRADLFVAIHADAFFHAGARGASVYALSQRGATSEAARWLAQRDNHTELDDVDLRELGDSSPMVRSVLIDMAQTVTIRDSVRLGNRLLDQLNQVGKLHYKRVEQAPFVVLKSPDIPSVLIETGFISNPQEETRLDNPIYQAKLAKAILKGILAYRQG